MSVNARTHLFSSPWRTSDAPSPAQPGFAQPPSPPSELHCRGEQDRSQGLEKPNPRASCRAAASCQGQPELLPAHPEPP